MQGAGNIQWDTSTVVRRIERWVENMSQGKENRRQIDKGVFREGWNDRARD